MNVPDPQEVDIFESMAKFFRKNPPFREALIGESVVDDEYAAAADEAFPNADDRIISVVEETVIQRKVLLLGLEIIDYDRVLCVYDGPDGKAWQVGYVGPAPVVRLPDGSTFMVNSVYDLAELRAKLKTLSNAAKQDGDRAHLPDDVVGRECRQPKK